MAAIYVDLDRVEVHGEDPALRVVNPSPARNSAGGIVRVHAWWSRDYISAYEAAKVAGYLREHPEDIGLSVMGIRIEADDPSYGTAPASVGW